MSSLLPLLNSHSLVPALSGAEAEAVAGELASDCALTVYPRSIAAQNGRIYFLGVQDGRKVLGILSLDGKTAFEGTDRPCRHGVLRLCPLTHENAAALRETLPYTAPEVAGPRKSIGMGDRLGLATPGHIRAVRGTGVFPILAQQSIREMSRTQRSPQQVLDDAAWGVFEEGYRDGYGADADHLKSGEDAEGTFFAGFRMFTIDPGEYVDNAAGKDGTAALKAKLPSIPWAQLETTEQECIKSFTAAPFKVHYDLELAFDEEKILRAVVKYGKAVAHTVTLYRQLLAKAGGRPFELEMSVDETDSPTTPHEHFYVAFELRRLGVKVSSLAPRFIGAFEKGVDYQGDLKVFEEQFIQHAKIARNLGPYKISIHSGSDKFAIYPIAAKHAKEMLHVKTAGTSYLEALRAIAQVAPALFREILAFALERYDTDRASYHVSADPRAVARPDKLADADLSAVLDDHHGRQVLHVTYGSVLMARNPDGAPRFYGRLMDALRKNEDVHYGIVARHLRKHIDLMTGR